MANSCAPAAAAAPINPGVFEDRFTKIPKDLHLHLLSFFPCSLPKEIDSRQPSLLNTGFVSEAHKISLKQAHALTEQLYAALAVSQISKQLYRGLAPARKALSNHIVEVLSALQNGHRGTRCFRECVDSGWYLKTLRVFFFYRPEALRNYATDPQREEGFQRTILHNAAMPNQYLISVPFVSFVLEMDRDHRLGLAWHRDYNGKTPLMRGREGFAFMAERPARHPNYPYWLQIEPMLVRHGLPPRPALSRPFLVERARLVEPALPPAPQEPPCRQEEPLLALPLPEAVVSPAAQDAPAISAAPLNAFSVEEPLTWSQKIKTKAYLIFSWIKVRISRFFSRLTPLFSRR